jgi:CHAT domain-containing protein
MAYQVYGTFLGLGTAERIAERGRLPANVLPEEDRQRLQDLNRANRKAVAQRDWILTERGKAQPAERKKLDEDLTAVITQMRRIEVDCVALIDQARLRQQVYVGLQYPKAATTEEVCSALDPGVALLEFAVDDGEVFAFVTTRDGQRLLTLGDAGNVLPDVEHVREAMTQKGAPPPEPRTLRRLGVRLLDPLLADLPAQPEIKTLLIAGHADLARIPFEILLLQDPDVDTKASERTMLLTRYDVAYVHSGTVMRAMKFDAQRRATAKQAGPEFVGFGFPLDAEAEGEQDVARTGLVLAERGDRKPIPGTALEVLEIGKILAKGESEISAIEGAVDAIKADSKRNDVRKVRGERFDLFLRSAATEKMLKADPAVRSARIVHLACHGEADLISPALSRLVLARSGQIEKATGEDGYVYLRELRDLRLTAELLVLSACSTNDGKLHPLEGMIGLSRAGLAAGAQAVISTFWRVEDEAARALMLDFYQRWLKGGTTRIAALNAAKRSAVKRGVPMKTWSAYALWDAQTK